MGVKFRTKAGRDAYRRSLDAPPTIVASIRDDMYAQVARWHNAGLPKPPGTPIEILARYLPKEKRWMVLVDGDEPFVCESASLVEAMRSAGTIIEAHS